jgi:phage/plasmid-associated DNA primase
VPRLACIFACNELPTSRDKALMGRFVVLDCPNVVAQADQNKRLGEQIHAEAPQIAAAAINAAARMLRNGAIAKPPTAESTQRDWQTDGDPVARWISEETVVSTETTSLADLYSRYRQWASAHGVFASGDVKFARQLRRNGVGQTRINNQHLWLLTISPARAAAAKRWGRPEGACHD